MSTPTYVMHDDERWRVKGTTDIDGEAFYDLEQRGRGYAKGIVARVSDCVVYKPQRTRRLKDHDIVLEFNNRGQVFVRKARSRKRFETSLPAIYSMTVKAHVAMQKSLKAAKRRKGKR